VKVIEYLRGITEDEARRLRGFGIIHTIDLVHFTEYKVDREKLAVKSGISEPRLLTLAHQASLLEVSGLTERHLQVLRRLGIVSLKDLRVQDAPDLQAKMVQAMGLAGAPSLGDVQYWISQARVIDIIEEEELPIEQLPPELTNLSVEAQRTEI
jgi:predicted RecB family nuclease